MNAAAARQATREALIDENDRLEASLAAVRSRLAWLERQVFGSKSERFVPSSDIQTTLQLDTPATDTPAQPATQQVSYTRRGTGGQTQGHGRGPMPTHLPVLDVVVEPTEDTSDCQRIGEEVTWEYEYEPGKFFIKRTIRPKYLRREQQGATVHVAPLPPRLIERGNAGPGLVARLMVDKYVYHLPLDRQRSRWRSEYQVEIAESTLCDLVAAGVFWIEPLYLLMVKSVKRASYLQADETPISVLLRDGRGKTHRGYYWVYHDPLTRHCVFEYQQGRGREGPNKFLASYQGVLQVDGYTGYDEVVRKPGIVRACCMAHIRRHFEEALDSDSQRARYALEQIGPWFEVERRAAEAQMDATGRLTLRQELAVPSMDAFGAWLKEQLTQVLPKSPIGKAVAYALDQWPALKPYQTDGRIELSNNLVENAVRPVALGRKNYMFAGSHDAAGRAAMVYSLADSAKRVGLDPFDYFRGILTQLPAATQDQLAQFLPAAWKARQPLPPA
jgi:transposase